MIPSTGHLSDKQLASLRESVARINVWHGSVRSGKTIASLLRFLFAVRRAPASGLILIVGRSLATIERNVIEPLQDPLLFTDTAAEVHHTRGATTAVILGRVVHLIGASDARSEGRLRGLTASVAYADEITLLPEPFFVQLLARLSVPGAILLGTTNPDGPRHWLKAQYLDRQHELDLRSWHFQLADNPALSPEYVAALAAEYTGLWRRRMILGEWCVAEGAVYDAYDEQRHVVDTLPAMRRYWAGVDYGTSNPFSMVLLGLGEDGRLYAVGEWRHDSRAERRQMTDAAYSRAVRDWLDEQGIAPEWTFIDPSAASFSTQLWADGYAGVARANNAVGDGIRSVANLLDSGRLLIHRSCEGLLAEFPSYVWDDAAAARGEDRPVKANDHSLDALRYAVHSTAHEWRGLLTPA
ncbi:PBSX family phage terminase large subunit [Streptomyces xanthochromogenes]|uniref:Phage terminase large subunit n=1 Tax=Streptomyces xanthochromogenes TaxID=67384 RepID=A0ABQ2ZZQ6_9ACTN|nr:PBSX family phage terminase large subunit [Streptomyces xanthochromogenes]GGY28043.1 phage terminase large subunit [Streptomyces xanthochromogenes]